MTDIKGIQTIAPPASLIPSIKNSIANAFISLPPGTKGGVFAVVSETGGKAVIATKLGGGRVQILGYVGKDWGAKVEAGAQAMITW
jgi:hypothetical protein